MRYFTDNPLERMMMQVPRQERGLTCPVRPKATPATAANATGRAASVPCYRGVHGTRRR